MEKAYIAIKGRIKLNQEGSPYERVLTSRAAVYAAVAKLSNKPRKVASRASIPFGAFAKLIDNGSLNHVRQRQTSTRESNRNEIRINFRMAHIPTREISHVI